MPDKGISRELTVFRASKRQTDVFQPFGGGFSRIASAFPSQDPRPACETLSFPPSVPLYVLLY